MAPRTPVGVLLFVPNLIGYVRLALFFVGAAFFPVPSIFLPAYFVNVVLDFFDGYFAKLLGQCSVFGAWFDVVIDNISRGFLWSQIHEFGYLMACVEWLVFVCTHTNQERWKYVFGNAPVIIQKVMENGLHSYYGWYAMAGSFWLPLLLYSMKFHLLGTGVAVWSVMIVLILGRVLTFIVESYIIIKHVEGMLEKDCKP